MYIYNMQIIESKRLAANILGGRSESGTERNTTERVISGRHQPSLESKRLAGNILRGMVRERHRAEHD
jgi:hypothetical protein